MIMARSILPWLLVLVLVVLISLSYVKAHPKLDLEDQDSRWQKLEDLSASVDQLAKENDRALEREEALQKIQEILGIRNQSENLANHKVPQFMMELYETVTDPSASTQGQNPYNAKVVRSFIERDTFLPNFYFFNVSGLEINESVLEAELHLYRKKMPLNISLYSYYLVRLYQVLNGRSLNAPHLHRLLDDFYVDAHDFGWQVFNVTQAVHGWLNDEPNLGFLVTVSDLFENKVSVEFSRGDDYHHNKQPILVLFNDVRSNRDGFKRPLLTEYYGYGNQDDDENQESQEQEEEKEEDEQINLEDNYGNAKYYSMLKKLRTEEQENEKEEENKINLDDNAKYRKRLRKNGQPEVLLMPNIRRELEFFQRQKRRRVKINEKRGKNEPISYDKDQELKILALEAATKRRRRDATSSKKKQHAVRIVSENHGKRLPKVLTSMDIYTRAEFRRRLSQKRRNQSSTRSRRSASPIPINSNSTETCTRHELYVDFEEIGLSSIIAPPGYDAYQCKGVCESPLSQDQQPTNHATIQAIVNKVNLTKDVEKPCCVPIKLKSISILFLENESSVVLKNFEDMVAERCGCR